MLPVIEGVARLKNGIVGGREIGEDRCPLFLEPIDGCNSLPVGRNQRRWNHVAGNRITGPGKEDVGGPEVSAQQRGGRQRHPRRILRLPQPFPVLPPEKKQFVFFDWTAQVVAKVVVPQGVPRGSEIAPRIQLVVPEILKHRPVELVCTILGHYIKRHARRPTILGRHVRSLHLHFRNEVRVHIVHQAAIRPRYQVERTIDRQILRIRPVAVDVLVRRGKRSRN